MLKRFCCTILCITILLALVGQPALAENNVTDISIDVVINNDGSAYITQQWNCKFTEGTEGYISIENLSEMSITNFLVSDESSPYAYIESWDISASYKEKIGKFGMLETDKGYELCWGISNYGENR